MATFSGEGHHWDLAEDKRFTKYVEDQLEKQPEDMVRFFDRDKFVTVHGRDAITVAQEHYKTSSVIKYPKAKEPLMDGLVEKKEGRPYVTMSKANAMSCIKSLLLEKRKRVEMYVSTGANRGWTLDKKASPGNLQVFEEDMLKGEGCDLSAVIMAIRMGVGKHDGHVVGAAFVDSMTRKMRTIEFPDNEQLSNLESIVCQQGAKEVLLPSNIQAHQKQKVLEVLDLCEVPNTEVKAAHFNDKDLDQDLRRLLGTNEVHGQELENKAANAALAALIKYLDLMGSAETHGLWTLGIADLSQYMRLDAGAMKALNVEPQPGELDKNASLFGVLNHCKTTMGARLLKSWLKQPLLNQYAIEERLDLVEAFVEDQTGRQQFQQDLRLVPSDLDRLAKKFSMLKANLQDVVRLYQFANRLPVLVGILEEHASQHAEMVAGKFTDKLQKVHDEFGKFMEMVEMAVDLDAVQRHEYLINPNWNENLKELHHKKAEVDRKIDKHLDVVAKDLKLEEGKVKREVEDNNIVMRITRKDEKALRNSAKYKTLKTRKEGVLFNDKHLRDMSAEYMGITKSYNEQQKDLASKVIETTATFAPLVEDANQVLSLLDVVVALAHAAVTAPEPFVRPQFLSNAENDGERDGVFLEGCRHPCLERMDEVSFIPNDVSLERGKSLFQIVTGPNMGGKSTYIRQVGVTALMAQAGSFVPCTSAQLQITDCILARVGAGDCQAKGVSTFMAEMLETANILKTATKNSLVIIDELGRGTSTYDGFGLAWAISEHIATQIQCPCLFATHFHELTELADQIPAVVNKHVTAHTDQDAMTMLYQVMDGPCEKSFGIHVAVLAKFPQSVIDAAKRKADELEDFGTSIALPGNKRAKSGLDQGDGEVDKEGRQLLTKFLKEFAALPLDKMSQDVAKAKVQELKDTLASSGNAFVQQVLDQA